MAEPASAHPVIPRHGTLETPTPTMKELSDRYCGEAAPMVTRVSPTKRVLIYGRMKVPVRSSVFTCPYENRSCQRVENSGNSQAVVRNRWLASRRFFHAPAASD